MFDLEFWKNFLSNFLATFIGIILGIPIALWINKNQQESAEKAQSKKHMEEAFARKEKILRLIKEELLENKVLLDKLHESRRDVLLFENRTYEYSYQLRSQLWHAFSDGGELQWIQDIDLLHFLALAYEGIRMVSDMEQKYSSFALSLGALDTDSKKHPKTDLHETRLYKRLHESIAIALNNVNTALEHLPQTR